jgi:hypothetical protein
VVISVAENQADMIAENEHFYQLLFGLDFGNLPSFVYIIYLLPYFQQISRQDVP